MRILFAHTNFPGQFGGIANWLAGRGWDVTFATQREDVRTEGMRILTFRDHRGPSRSTHRYLRGTERAVITGQGFGRAAVELRGEGFRPDIVVAHSGWGAGLFAKDVWPETKFVQYAEWYYTAPAIDGTPHDPPRDRLDERARARVRNAPFWLDFSAADATISPTRFQAARFPDKISGQIEVVHDGVDTDIHCPASRDHAFLLSLGIPANGKLVTYIARGMEPVRGFPEFMQAVARLQRRMPDVHVVVVGQDRVAYGPNVPGTSWKTKMLEQLDLDAKRLHFTGILPRASMIRLLQASDVHLYLSVPFVLSWSFLEAMSCAAPIVASDTEPVREFMEADRSGLLVDPHDIDQVVDATERLLNSPETARSLGRHARQAVVGTLDAKRVAFPRFEAFLREV